jgi:ATP-dependent HslUV protease subunit HslV
VTTIAYRNGIIAADTGMTIGGSQIAQTMKITKNSRGDVCGCCGESWWGEAFRKWFETGAGDPPSSPGTGVNAALVVLKSRRLRIYESSTGTVAAFDLRAPYYAIGSGRCEALGAMFAGATARDAVRAAMHLDDGTFGRVTSLQVGK